MISEILFVVLVLVVAALMAVDLIRTRGESSHGHAERQAHGADRLIAAPLRSSGASMFSPEPARSVATAPASAAVPPAAAIPAPAAGPSARQDEATRAFDQTDRETSRSAASDGDRDRFNIFVNLSHRSQSLVDRQLRLIEDLEHGERDAHRLTSLSKLNRIAVRIYRNSQNLLILAGHQPSPRWNQPVTLAQLVRAALAEVEDYERVSSDIQADVAVRGPAVNDLVHLLVELIENATSFSAAEMPVHIKGQILTTGGALVDITDRGIGMAANEMAYANQQLDNPPGADIDVPKWMGLLVVSRLAARHGIRVRLNQAELGGLIALVWLPDEILTHHGAAADPSPLVEQRAAAANSMAFAPARVNMPDASAARPDPAWVGPRLAGHHPGRVGCGRPALRPRTARRAERGRRRGRATRGEPCQNARASHLRRGRVALVQGRSRGPRPSRPRHGLRPGHHPWSGGGRSGGRWPGRRRTTQAAAGRDSGLSHRSRPAPWRTGPAGCRGPRRVDRIPARRRPGPDRAPRRGESWRIRRILIRVTLPSNPAS